MIIKSKTVVSLFKIALFWKCRLIVADDNFQFGAQQDVFSSNVQLEQNIISIQTQQNTLREIDTENVLNIEYVENNENHMFEVTFVNNVEYIFIN